MFLAKHYKIGCFSQFWALYCLFFLCKSWVHKWSTSVVHIFAQIFEGQFGPLIDPGLLFDFWNLF